MFLNPPGLSRLSHLLENPLQTHTILEGTDCTPIILSVLI